MLRFPALHLSTVFHMGAEMVQRYSQEPSANFTAVSGTLAQVHVQCMNHCRCADCAACAGLTRNVRKYVEYVYCKSRAFAGPVASMR